MVKVGINGFGRIGRLVMRAVYDNPNLKVCRINDPAGDASTLAHLLTFDSIQGRWRHQATADGNQIYIENCTIECSQDTDINQTDWSECDVVIEASGKMRDVRLLQNYLDQGVSRVVVTAPVDDQSVLNVVMGINDELFNPSEHRIVTAASCTTNCLAPIVKVVLDTVGIKHGSITSIHNITNTQSILDQPHRDLRRARSCGSNLIPTTTGSAKAIALIFPQLAGRINGHAVRVPLANASLTDCVFETERETTETEINTAFRKAADDALQGILGYEERPLVSEDFRGDARSCVVDALSTMVVDGTQLKVYGWYDNEWGYANRTVELAQLVSRS